MRDPQIPNAKKELQQMAGKPCEYCRRPMSAPSRAHKPSEVTRDHYQPKAHGYRLSDPGNKRFSCRECNELKGAMTGMEWERFMRENPNWWGRSPRGNPTSNLNHPAEALARFQAKEKDRASQRRAPAA